MNTPLVLAAASGDTASAGAAATTAAQAAAPSAVAGGATLGQPGAIFSWGGYFQSIAILFLLVAVLWFVLRYLKQSGGLARLTGQGALALESRLTLGAKKSLIIVRAEHKRLLLGVTDHSITLLTELSDDDEEDEAPAPEAGTFHRPMTKALHDDTPAS